MLGATQCVVEHVGLVVSGHATGAMKDGTTEPYVSLHFLGAMAYAKK